MAKKHLYIYDESDASARDDSVVLRFDEGTLLLESECERDFRALGCKFDDRVDTWRAPARLYRRIVGELVTREICVVDRARSYCDLNLSLASDGKTPYEHQEQSVAAWLAASRRGTVVLPTGSGKSFVAELCLASIQRTALIVVPTLDLVEQWARQLGEAFDIPIGLMGGGEHDVRDVTVSTYDSAAIHMDRLGDRFGLLVFDEVHHLPGEIYRTAAESSIAPFRLGLTATLERQDGKHQVIEDLVGPTVYRKSIKELSGDILADYDVETIEVDMAAEDAEYYASERAIYRGFVESNGIRLGGRRGWQSFLAATSRSEEGRRALVAYQNQKRTALAHSAKVDQVSTLLAQHRDDRVIIFTNDNDSVYEISERLLCPSITHQTPLRERAEILDRFREGTYSAVVTSKVLNEGVDVPEARVAIVLSGTGSVREHVQRLGRILRRGESKRAILYELVTSDSVETFVSERRRDHDAYR